MKMLQLAPFLLLALTVNVSAGERGEWNLPGSSPQMESLWREMPDVQPDLHPDQWSFRTLTGYESEVIMLRSSGGAMLRRASVGQLQAINKVRQQVESAAELQVDFYLMRGDEPNAAAGIKDGRNMVFVNFGMLDMIGDRTDLWAALIGHEIAHLKLGHGRDKVKREIPLQVLKTVAAGVLASNPLAATGSGYLIDGIGTKFSRDAERQADYMGLIWAVESGFDPHGASQLHQLLLERKTDFSVPFLSTHPGSRERAEQLAETAEGLSK